MHIDRGVLLNAATTGDHLLATLGRGQWAVAGMDLMLLVGAVIAWVLARRLSRAPSSVKRSRRDHQTPAEGQGEHA